MGEGEEEPKLQLPAHLHADDGVDEEKHGDEQAHVGQRLHQGVISICSEAHLLVSRCIQWSKAGCKKL